MKNFRLLAAFLFAAIIGAFASGQQSDDITALRTKAEKGNGLAQYNLGLAYAEGHGVPVDRLEAYVWLSLARESGARGRALDSLVASFDKATLEAAQHRLADQKATAAEKMPAVATRQAEPEAIATVKTTGAAYLSPTASSTGQDVPSLSQQVTALTADKKQLSEEVAKAWKEIDALNAALSKTGKETKSPGLPPASAADLENATKFNRELEASLNRANEQKAALEQNLAAVQVELTRAKGELSAQSQKDEKRAAAEAARLTPSAEMASLRNQLGAVQTQSAALATELATVRASETQLHDTIAQLEQEKAQLSSKPSYPDLSGKVGELEAQLARANHNLEATTQAAAAASKQGAADLSASAAEILRLQTAAAAKPNAPSYPDLSGKVGELEAQLARANHNLEATTQAAAAASKQGVADLSASAAEILRLQTAAAAKPNAPSYPDLSSKVRELEANLADSTQKLAAIGSAQSELQRKLTEASATAQNSAKAATEAVQLRRERDELSGHVASLTGENTELRKDRERMQKLAADSGKQLREADVAANRIKELETQTAALQTSLSAANVQVLSLQHSLAAKSEAPAYPDLSGKVRELETKLTAANHQADAAVKTAVNASKQSTTDLNAAADKIAKLEAALAAKPAAVSAPDLSGRVRELETQLADAKAETNQANQEATALGKARDEALKNRGPGYPNLAGRVVELQTALADAKRDLSDAQNALHAAEQARTAAAAPAAVASPEPATTAEPTDLQKQLAETENKLATALRGYALLQHDHDEQIETASKSTEAVTTERNALATQVASLTAEVEQLKTGTSNQTTAAQADVTRANDSLAALQRSTSQNSSELTSARALVQQLKGANTVLANENYQLKSRLSIGGTPPTPNASVASVPVPTATRTHVIAAGDTLFRISQRYYGTPNRWQEIYKANAAKLGTNGVLRVGAELVIP